jgi:hypothetical protein
MAMPTACCSGHYDMIAGLQAGYATTDLDHHTCTLVPPDHRKLPLAKASHGRKVRMTNACRLDLDQDFAFAWALEHHIFDMEGLALSIRSW